MNGELCIGLFANRDIPARTELTYDYRLQSFEKQQIQACFCGAENCRGQIGTGIMPDSSLAQAVAAAAAAKSAATKKHGIGKKKKKKSLYNKDGLSRSQVRTMAFALCMCERFQ